MGIVTVLVLVAAGCHSSGGAAPDAAGSGGQTGQGGEPGPDGAVDRAGTGGSDARTDAKDAARDSGSGLGGCLGVCLETFYAQCPKVGQSCITATSNGTVVNCYANGVKQAQVQSNGITTTVLQTTDGHTCYESDLTGTTETIKDLDGKMIAQITHTSATLLTIECYGADGSAVTTQADLTSAACAATYAATTETCTAGACAF